MKHHFNNYVFIGVLSFLIWGLYPIYFKMLAEVSAFEIILHRIIWSSAVLFCVLLIIKKFSSVKKILHNKVIVVKLLCSGILITANWLIFVWAINKDRILDTSLGYYTSPLLTIFLGLFIFKEKIGIIKKIAILLTCIALAIKLTSTQSFSFVSIGVAVTFSLYGLIKKKISENSLVLFFIEITFMAIPALIIWGYMLWKNQSAFNNYESWTTIFFLLGLGIVTPTPLLLYNYIVRHVDLNILGFIQYITPSMTFLLATLLYKEPFAFTDIVVFSLIWIAIILVSIENYKIKNKIKS